MRHMMIFTYTKWRNLDKTQQSVMSWMSAMSLKAKLIQQRKDKISVARSSRNPL